MLEAVLYTVDGIDDIRYLIEEQSHSGVLSVDTQVRKVKEYE